MADPASTRLGSRTLTGLALAASLVPLNSTMIAVALPDIADDLDVSSGSTGALVTVYLIVMLVGQPAMGRLTDVVGAGVMLRGSLLGFAAASAGSALAPGFALLVVGRAVQAAFGAALIPAAQAMLRSLSDPETRGRSFGLLGSFIGTGAALGPVIGGGVIELGGWPGIFIVNLPLTVAALILLTPLPRDGTAREHSDAPEGGVRRVLTQRVFVASFMTQSTSTLTQYSLLLAVPLALDGRGWSSGSIGLALTSLTAGMVLLGPVGGRVGDRRGRRYPVVSGLAVGAAAMLLAAAFVESSTVAVVVAMAVFGIGLGFAAPSIQTAALEAVPERYAGSASGVLSMSRYTGSIPASILLTLLVDEGGDGATLLLSIAAVAMFAALGFAYLLPSRRSA
jgi:MFS family permease